MNEQKLPIPCGHSRIHSPAAIFIALTLSGCVDPITQYRCDHLAKEAIQSIRERDAEGLESQWSSPKKVTAFIEQLPEVLPHGTIKYRGDSYMFPLPTYERYYELMPDAAHDPVQAQSLFLTFTFTSDPVQIEAIFHTSGTHYSAVPEASEETEGTQSD